MVCNVLQIDTMRSYWCREPVLKLETVNQIDRQSLVIIYKINEIFDLEITIWILRYR